MAMAVNNNWIIPTISSSSAVIQLAGRHSGLPGGMMSDVSSLELDKELESCSIAQSEWHGKWLIFEITPCNYSTFRCGCAHCTLSWTGLMISTSPKIKRIPLKNFFFVLLICVLLKFKTVFLFIQSSLILFFYFIFCSVVCNKLHSGNAYCIRFLNILFLYFNFLIKLWNCILHFS